MDKLFGCFNCGSYFLYPDLDEYDEPAFCPECGSTNWAPVEPIEKKYTRLIRRKNGFRKAIRRRNICRMYQTGDWYNNLHQYADNKIHCSCPMCRAKTSKIKMRKAYGPGGKNWDLADIKRIEEMDDELYEFQMIGDDYDD